MTIKYKGLALIGLICLLLTSICFAETTYGYKAEDIKISGGTRLVKWVWFDLKDPALSLDLAVANNQVGTVQKFETLVGQEASSNDTVIAAINGGFFNAYADLQPQGTLLKEGETQYFNTGVHFGVDFDKNAFMLPLDMSIEGGINGSYTYPNNFDAWNINYLYNDSTQTVIFTPDYGKSTPVHGYTSIVVSKGVVTAISSGKASIPVDGFVIVSGASNYISRFSIGASVDYRIKYHLYDFKTKKRLAIYDPSEVKCAVSAGPTLLKNGQVVIDAASEGFTEAKIVTGSNQRSFIGYKTENSIVMGVVSNVTMAQLADICKSLGLKEAMNLDGGASSALLYGGKTIQAPGRLLNNALVLKKSKVLPVSVALNGKGLFFDVDPFQDPVSKRVVVPMRKLFEVLGAKVTWIEATKEIKATKGDTDIVLQIGSSVALVNGQSKALDVPVQIVRGSTFVPLRFVTETFGGTVQWNDLKRLVTLTVDGVGLNSQALYSEAVALAAAGRIPEAILGFQKVLEVDANYVDAYKALGDLYRGQKDYGKAIPHYEAYLAIHSKSYEVWGTLGWAYYSFAYIGGPDDLIKNLEASRDAFAMQISLDQTQSAGYYGFGLLNADSHIENKEEAIKSYRKALALGVSAQQKEVIDRYLSQ